VFNQRVDLLRRNVLTGHKNVFVKGHGPPFLVIFKPPAQSLIDAFLEGS